MNRRLGGAIAALLACGYLALGAAALVPAPWLALGLAAALVVSELVLTRVAPALLPGVVRQRLGVRFRLLSVDVLVTVLAARVTDDARVVAALVVAVVLLHGARDAAGIFGRRVGWRRNGGPVSWRGLDVPGLPRPVSPRRVPRLSAPLSLLTLVLPLGLALTDATGTDAPAFAAAVLVGASAVLEVAGRGAQYLVLNRVPRQEVRAALRDAVEAYGPQVVVHFSGRRGTTDQLAQWLPALAGLPARVLLMVREAHHLDALEGAGLPVVFAPLSTDVELLTVPSIDLALYPTDVTNINNHLLRVPGVYDVLIGHGESDEAENASPIARMYDEVWVPGPLGADRYADVRTAVPAHRIRRIGPLPLALRAASAGPPDAAPGVRTLLYAPNWESVLDSTDTSSLLHSGAGIVDAALTLPRTRLLFAPAGGTGSRVREYTEAVERLSARVRRAGGAHAVLTPLELPSVLPHATLVVTDVSPVVADAVLADVPYAVPLPPDTTESALRADAPTLAAGAVLHDVAALGALLEDASGADARASARAALRPRLFGQDPHGFPAALASAVESAMASQRARRAFVRPRVETPA